MSQALQQPRSTVDLINELEAEAKSCATVGLAVGFEHRTLFIFSGGANNLENLNAMVNDGGQPVGFIRYDSDGKGHIAIAYRLLQECADDPWMKKYLEGLTREFVSLVRAATQARI